MPAIKLSKTQHQVLRALSSGATLKSHRYLDGRKVYLLHPLEGPAETVRSATIEKLKAQGLIDSNKKFPAATYLLTEQGRRLVESLTPGLLLPLSARNY
jgi:hypothetical protein